MHCIKISYSLASFLSYLLLIFLLPTYYRFLLDSLAMTSYLKNECVRPYKHFASSSSSLLPERELQKKARRTVRVRTSKRKIIIGSEWNISRLFFKGSQSYKHVSTDHCSTDTGQSSHDRFSEIRKTIHWSVPVVALDCLVNFGSFSYWSHYSSQSIAILTGTLFIEYCRFSFIDPTSSSTTANTNRIIFIIISNINFVLSIYYASSFVSGNSLSIEFTVWFLVTFVEFQFVKFEFTTAIDLITISNTITTDDTINTNVSSISKRIN